MKAASQIDYLIVGQGLAGSAVALQLSKRGYKILVLDEPSKNICSQVAAGLFNPVTGRNMVKTWLADELFRSLYPYYRDAERLTKRKFFYPMPLYRPFGTVEEQNEWMSRSAEDIYRDYILEIISVPRFQKQVKDPLGGIMFRHSGYVDTITYLEGVRNYLLGLEAFQAQNFDDDKLIVRENSVQYGDVSARKIIFCQGVQNKSNRWFSALPVKKLKGETLTVQCDWKKDVILNRGVYMVPGTLQNEWRIGATYYFNEVEPGITDGARTELIEKLSGLIDLPYKVTGQEWGFRPTTPDRKPIIGAHPKYSPLIIFNGLGTKGVSLAPYFSEVLVRSLENMGSINKEADVTRYI